ncbi:TaqI-like C-terminal specificity domain-containing protein (plasmid) [Spirosoma sp. SC4-14]|uniref:Eco57I restriction-modification methylase domain-containing protein n=1 Tax=Spirosoma sp. SC4-14 TaxID=3128900 RepID=UPI0030D33899
MTKDAILNLLQKAYDRTTWQPFIRELFGSGTYYTNPEPVFLPANELADKAVELGSFMTTDNRQIGLFEVQLKVGVRIEGRRVGLRQLLKSMYKLVDGALVVFICDDGTWRFSYVSEIFTYDASGNQQELKTEPKRFTYALGRGKNTRTAADRFYELAQRRATGVLLDDLRRAFSVETLTKEFYRELSDWYFWALQHVRFPEDAETNTDIRNATNTIRLITRLIFVWFLKQKKQNGGLIPDDLFDRDVIAKLIKGFRPDKDTLFTSTGEGDKTGSTYYKAILQNLFFATLNTEMTGDNRKFISRQYGVQEFYRYERYFQDVERFLELTQPVPFLNGGLFENLDRNVGEPNEIRIDCFSNKRDNEERLAVPDFLFFGEDVVDLSSIYDDKKRKAVRVRGLIRILNSYNFTIEENTPTEIEVALDPELLGKVFENLLASYNPETRTTARKQTGSFYTPREVVEYMVDEGLKVQLARKLTQAGPLAYAEPGSKQTQLFGNEVKRGQLSMVAEVATAVVMDETEAIEQLTELFRYDSEANPFDSETSRVLTETLCACRIFDLACGSGAFPMGVLQRMVHLLRKLDPQNDYLRELQLRPVMKEIEQAIRKGGGGPVADLQSQVQDIIRTFNENTDDYGRKLFLIENCLYGADIQPIAVQICKLRFFISLVVEQQPDAAKPNLGIRPLPNLETKFVAANTLIGLERQGGLIRDLRVEALEKDLEDVRHKHFRARSAVTKKKYRDQDNELRNQIADLLKASGWKTATADQIAAWNPYDQNTHASFFDAEWMFGITDGFDLVIGNPPYVQLQKLGKVTDQLQKQGYQTFVRTGDLYCLFYEAGMNALRKNGVLSFITSNKWMKAGYGQALRKFLTDKCNPLKLIDFGGYQVFDATVDTNILIIEKAPYQKQTYGTVITRDFEKLANISVFFQLNSQLIPLGSPEVGWVILSPAETRIKRKIEEVGKPLKEWDVNIYRGILTGYNDAFIINGNIKDQLLQKCPEAAEIIRPVLRGRDIKRYKANFEDLWLLYIPWHFPIQNDESINGNSLVAEQQFKLHYPAVYEHLSRYKKQLLERNPAETCIRYEWYAMQRFGANYVEDFSKRKIIWGNLNVEATFSLDELGSYILAPCNLLTSKNQDIEYLLILLNSPVTTYFMKNQGYSREGGYVEYKRIFLEQLPIPVADLQTLKLCRDLASSLSMVTLSKSLTDEIEQEAAEIAIKKYGLTLDEKSYLFKVAKKI